MIEKNDILYFFIVVIVAAAVASAWAGMTHEPVPLQVSDNRIPVVTFTPAPAPPPALPTYDPQLVPGSYADTHRNSTDNGKFSPAPAPVVVTTMPLPTITTIQTPTIATTSTQVCCKNSWNSTQVEILSSMQSVFGLFPILFAAIIIMGVMMMMIRVEDTNISPLNSGMNGFISTVGSSFSVFPIIPIMGMVIISVIAPLVGEKRTTSFRRGLGENANTALIPGMVMLVVSAGMIFIMLPILSEVIMASTPVISSECVPC